MDNIDLILLLTTFLVLLCFCILIFWPIFISPPDNEYLCFIVEEGMRSDNTLVLMDHNRKYFYVNTKASSNKFDIGDTVCLQGVFGNGRRG